MKTFYLILSLLWVAAVEPAEFSADEKKTIELIEELSQMSEIDFENMDLSLLKDIYYIVNDFSYKIQMRENRVKKASTEGLSSVWFSFKKKQKQIQDRMALLLSKMQPWLISKIENNINSWQLASMLHPEEKKELSESISLIRILRRKKKLYAKELEILNNTTVHNYALIDENKLKSLKLCPIFVGLTGEPKYHVLIDLKNVLSNQEQLKKFFPTQVDRDILESEIEDYKRTGKRNLLKDQLISANDLPCFVPYNKKNNQAYDIQSRYIFQLRSINQSMGEFKRLGTQHCSGFSIHNGIDFAEYVATGSDKYLIDLYNEQSAAKFISDFGCLQRIDKEILDGKFLSKLSPEIRESFKVINSPSNLDETTWEFAPDIKKEMQEIKNELKKGLKKPFFFYSFIVGTGDEQAINPGMAAQHWYYVALVKHKTTIQYVVIDTAADYHLQPGSYELNRLHYLIDLIEDGKTDKQLFFPEE